jgi:pyrroline-5-carboxylate reductase
MKLAFIGGGNVATALISGISQSPLPPEFIHVSDPNESARRRLEERFPVTGFESATAAVTSAHAVVLAVKPQVMPVVLEELQGHLEPAQLVISVAAGITLGQIGQWLGAEQPVVRCMPNTPALIGKGITGLCAGTACSDHHRHFAQRVLAAAGATVWVEDERLMDVVTAVSGSGPAYFYYLVEALTEAGAAQGLPADVAAELALHTARGAGDMALQSDLDIAQLRQAVTTPGGTTEAALDEFSASGFKEMVRRAVRAATDRGRLLSGGNGGDA